MACGLCHGLNDPRPCPMMFKQHINTTLKSLGASAGGGCPYCDLFRQSVSLNMAEEKLEQGEDPQCTIAKYYTDDVCISVSWGDRSMYDPQRTILLYMEKGTYLGRHGEHLQSRLTIIRQRAERRSRSSPETEPYHSKPKQ